MELGRNPITHDVTHDKYEVFHLLPHDEFCDLHLLAHTENDSEQLLIPVHKKVLISNIEYFANMFKDTSNFIENKNNEETNLEKSCSETDLKTAVPIVKIQVENPRLFGKYLKTFYGEKLYLTDENCLDVYKLADFFTDDDMIEKVSKFINDNNLSSENIIKLVSYTEKFDKVMSYYIEHQFLDINEAYNLSQTSNKFKESLDKYFKDFSNIINSVKIDKGLERMMVMPKAEKFDCSYDSSSIHIVLENNKAIFRKTGKSDWNTGIIIFPNKGIKSYKITLCRCTQGYYPSILTGWTEHNSKQNDWHTPGSNNWTKTICHQSKNGSFYHDIKEREYGNAAPKITWTEGYGRDNQTNYIIVKKEDNYNLSWKQGEKINVRDSSSFGFKNNKNLFPVIAMDKEGCTVEISDVEIE